ncbi:MAG TPA: adenylate/guanylate cyclase domain-containing protein [Roseiflexaceae bacterium]|nr:adenylate/guanylate cyclase domain-containing protein [Roseiflexaceae bacterium]
MEAPELYIPIDRRVAMARGQSLPEHSRGAALFADVSGFTPLTDALVRALGPQRGAEELPRQLNRVYDALIAEVDRWGGSVIGFSGDAITCWFDDRDGPAAPRAAACALAMQHSMAAFTSVPLPTGGTAAITLKVAIASGPARRFVVGDPAIQQIDVLAGATVTQVSLVEHETRPGEVLLDQLSLAALGDAARVVEWRSGPGDERYALLGGLAAEPDAEPWPELAPDALSPAALRPWVLPAVYERSQAGLGDFLTELRPLAALFVHFSGLDYDLPDAGTRLGAFISDVQHALARYDGTLLQITIGDKGSYLYAGFGAPTAHEDDPRRAVLAALALGRIAAANPSLTLRIGISQGMLLVGVYGSAARTYAAIGDEVNVAARLMMQAAPGEILISGAIQKAVTGQFALETRAPIQLKGKSQPMVIAAVRASVQLRPIRLEEPHYALPMIGRMPELAMIEAALEQTLAGTLQLVSISAEAGLGKSRLLAEGIRLARRRGLIGYGSACLATATSTPYYVWQTIWRTFFDLDPETPAQQQIHTLAEAVAALAPGRTELLPLLGPLLGLSIEENDLTRSLAPKGRQQLLHTLLADCLRAAAQAAKAEDSGLLLVLEDLHWIDAASVDLLRDLTDALSDLPILILFAYRPLDPGLPLAEAIATLPHRPILLDRLEPSEAAELIRIKLDQIAPEAATGVTDDLAARLTERAQGNPFYLEELLNYLHDRGIDPRDSAALAALELPDTLYSLVLSRLDQLSARQQALLKTASVIGRRFLVAWLHGAFADTGLSSEIQSDLGTLLSTDLTALDTPEPELAYLFKHVVTQEVAYTSLSPSTRALLHGQLAVYLETLVGDAPDAYLDLLAYHYDRSADLPKRREYLRRAGKAAAGRFANDAALDYLNRALTLVPEDDRGERFDLLLAAEQVYDVLARRETQAELLAELSALSEALDDDQRRLHAMLRHLVLVFASADHQGVAETAQEAVRLAEGLDDKGSAALAYIYWASALFDQGAYDESHRYTEQALELARQGASPMNEALSVFLLGLIDQIHGKYTDARDWFMQAISLYRAAGNRREEANMLRYHAHMLMVQGDVVAACNQTKQSRSLYHSLGDPEGEGWASASLAYFNCMRGALGEAVEAIERSTALLPYVDMRRSTSYRLFASGIVYDQLGDYVRARAVQEQALELVMKFRAYWVEVSYRSHLAMIDYHQGRHTDAIAHTERVVELGRAYGLRHDLPLALLVQGHAHTALRAWHSAATAYQSAIELYQTMGQQHLICEARAGLIRAALAQGDQTGARQHLEAIVDQTAAHRLDGTYDPLQIYLTCYEALAQFGDPRAGALLHIAHDQLQHRAATLADPDARRVFLEEIEVNRRIAELWSLS